MRFNCNWHYRCFEGIKASICSKDKIGLSRVHCGKLANKRKANARESVERRKREISFAGETSGISILFFLNTFRRYNPRRKLSRPFILVVHSAPSPDNVLFSRDVYFPAGRDSSSIRAKIFGKDEQKRPRTEREKERERERDQRKGRKEKRVRRE